MFQMFMFQQAKAKEMVLWHEAQVWFPSLLMLEMPWNTVYFTGCWVEWGQNGTDLLCTHSQLNTKLCNEAQADEFMLNNTLLWHECIFQGYVVFADVGIQCFPEIDCFVIHLCFLDTFINYTSCEVIALPVM